MFVAANSSEGGILIQIGQHVHKAETTTSRLDVIRRLDPSCLDLTALCGNLPMCVAAMAASMDLLPVLAPKVCSNSITCGDSSNSGRSGADAWQPASSRSGAGLLSGRARNLCLEAVMASCRSSEVQVCNFSTVLTQHSSVVGWKGPRMP
jgi:hypothetical protein